ncbi:MAG: SAM-dependent methyltransferase [Candidatus Nitronauta litoralis]|uniref:SAM-dependent methyltransferase n=1 Tax=Candidatus Nitronauta litoralis TaxID=2705533 RepID=A0A7T0BU58_9BACT|nr:MAG: SAM-dependent methyltransferase [Candidatus Nitronauta litoralis]
MAMQLKEVVPFGRSLEEYRLMFNLTEADIEKSILSVADGPASFNAEMAKINKSVISLDPLYRFDALEIRNRFFEVVDDIIDQVKQSPGDWVWNYHGSPENLKKTRTKVLNLFQEDYQSVRRDLAYKEGALPELNFPGKTFELVLCSHFLFLYSKQLDHEFHLKSIKEMIRVGNEVRIFPLLSLMLEKYPHLDKLIHHLKQKNLHVEIVKVPYELQRGGDEMLIVKRR